MKKFLIIALMLFGINNYGQKIIKIDSISVAEFNKLDKAFKELDEKYSKGKDTLEKLKSDISNNSNPEIGKKITKQLEETQKIQYKLDSIYKLFISYKQVYLNKEIPEKTIDSLFNHKYKISEKQVIKENQTQKTYIYFGKDKVLAENDGIFKDKTVNLIFNDILEAKSETYLGDFSIPQNGQKIEFENVNRKKWFNERKYEINDKNVFFKSVKIHLFEGSLCDIKLIVTDDNNQEYLFENKVPSSLLKFSRLNHKRYLYCKPVKINGKIYGDTINKLLYYRIKSSDVLNYNSNPGNNYVPEDETLEFPLIENEKETNANNPAKYKIISDSSLQNIVELRAYTDFLGLFGDTPNGIVQLEGKADFYISPFNIPHTNSYVLKKITPFVHFSKIEKDVRNLNLTAIDNSTSTIKNQLEILEKSYLKMGLNLSVFSFKFTKEFPFDTNLYTTANYQISDLLDKDSIQVNYKSLGLGAGLALEFKRYNNFGFIYSAEFTKYNANSFNEIEGIINPDNFWVFKNEAEVYYFPNKSKEQAIFLRFKTFNNSTKNNSEAFYQLQFGYRFAIGVSKLKQ